MGDNESCIKTLLGMGGLSDIRIWENVFTKVSYVPDLVVKNIYLVDLIIEPTNSTNGL